MIACPRCASEVRPGMLRCRNCGFAVTEAGRLSTPPANQVRPQPETAAISSSGSLANAENQDQTCPQCHEQLRPASLRCHCGWRRDARKSGSTVPQPKFATSGAEVSVEASPAPSAMSDRETTVENRAAKIDRPSPAGATIERTGGSGLRRSTPKPVKRTTKSQDGPAARGSDNGTATKLTSAPGKRIAGAKFQNTAAADDLDLDDLPAVKKTDRPATVKETSPERKRGTLSWWARRTLTKTLATQGLDNRVWRRFGDRRFKPPRSPATIGSYRCSSPPYRTNGSSCVRRPLKAWGLCRGPARSSR